ncbi:MAG: NADH-quinone oxidoreductase subunit NuoB [Xanthomonadaceae bacterium]|nr:NADH-quinone oxidoreductase subunit NuoB [Xanthomonadaceae bacterium]
MEATGITGWAEKNSFKYYLVPSTCCSSEWIQAASCRYDLERFGCVEVLSPEEAELLIIQGFVNEAMAGELKETYSKMPHPKKVLALGACASQGGSFFEKGVSAHELFPVDVWAAGCPPRPEAIMNAILVLQKGSHK